MKEERIILATAFVAVSLIVSFASFIYVQQGAIIDEQKYYIDIVLKTAGGIGILAVAWWRWRILKRKSDDDAYLKTIEILADEPSQAAFIGVAHSFYILAKRNHEKYAKAAVVAIESSIRELSEASYYGFLSALDQHTASKGTLKERKRIPAIVEMLRIVLELRKSYDKVDYPSMNLGFADLRDLSSDVMDLNREAFRKAILNRADLRYVDFLKTTALDEACLGNAWVNIKRFDILAELNNRSEKIFYRQQWLKKYETRFFLTGNWGCDVEIYDDEIYDTYVDIFVDSRIGGGPGVQFNGMNMTGCDFRYAMLRGASFKNATLTDADFLYADLVGANFTGATGKAFFEGAIGDIPDSIKKDCSEH